MPKNKNSWVSVSKQNIPQKDLDTNILTYKMEVSGGYIYLVMIKVDETWQTETIFVPDIKLSAKGMAEHFPGMIDKVKRGVDKIEQENFKKGDYAPGIVDNWYSKKKPEIPDHLPPGFDEFNEAL